jgi:lysophospholipase L1-like esterase
MIWNEITCLGDSITFGARDRYGRSYPAELAKKLFETTGEFYYCHNHGICGETSSDLLRRSWSNISSHPGAKIMLLMIGTNDTQKGIDPTIYEDNIRQIVSIAKCHGQTIIVATLPELEFTPLYLKNKDYIKKYNKVLEKLSKELGFVICDMSGTEKFYIDGVHYTHEGNLELADRFYKKITKI